MGKNILQIKTKKQPQRWQAVAVECWRFVGYRASSGVESAMSGVSFWAICLAFIGETTDWPISFFKPWQFVTVSLPSAFSRCLSCANRPLDQRFRSVPQCSQLWRTTTSQRRYPKRCAPSFPRRVVLLATVSYYYILQSLNRKHLPFCHNSLNIYELIHYSILSP